MSDDNEMRTYHYDNSLLDGTLTTGAYLDIAATAMHHHEDMNHHYSELSKMYDGADAITSLSEPQIRANTPPPETPQIPVLANPAPETNVYPISPGMKGTLRRVTTITYDSPVKVLNGYATPELISPSKFLSKLHCDEEMPPQPTSSSKDGDDEDPEKPKLGLNLPNVVRECARSLIRYLQKKNGYVTESELNVVVESHLKVAFARYVEKQKLYNYLKNCRPIQSVITLFEELGLIEVNYRDEERATKKGVQKSVKKYIITVTEYRLVTTIPNMHTLKKLL